MIYYDITDILEYARTHDTLSGIQRVSIQLLTHFVNKHGADKLRLIAWHPIQKRILVFDASYFAGDYRYDQDEFCRRFLLKKIPIKLIFSLGLYRKAKYWRRPLHYGRLLLTGTTATSLPRLGRPLLGSRSRAAFRAGDLLFISGATWNFDRYLSILADARKQSGLTICQFIHDLIPLLTPEHVVDDVPDRFYWWLDRLSQHVDFFMTNSKA
ncbi:MAG TPA: hypothetical protein VFZ16_15185, partial [Hyphomicrobiaceae bacterium]|nr:hypothetical protein [Hyphomicrobiaceae bacterium]